MKPSVFYAIHPRHDHAHVVRLLTTARGRPVVPIGGATADCGEGLEKGWDGWGFVAEADFPLEGVVSAVCEGCKANAPSQLETDPPPAGAETERPAGPPRKPSEIAEDLERIRAEIKSPRLRDFLTRTINTLRGQGVSGRGVQS